MLSIIIPTLNEEGYIDNLLECLAQQTYKDFEVIVVDGNSDDKTQEIVKGCSKRFNNIKLINSNIRNVSHQRNLGVSHAANERIFFADADITIKNNLLEKALAELEKNNIDIAGCYLIPNSENIMDKLGHKVLNLYFYITQFFYPQMVGQCIFSTKKIHNKLGGFDPTIKLGEDGHYTSRSKKYGKFRVLDSVNVTVSMRRFEIENKYLLSLKYILMVLHRWFLGEIRSDIFNYRMGVNYKKLKK